MLELEEPDEPLEAVEPEVKELVGELEPEDLLVVEAVFTAADLARAGS